MQTSELIKLTGKIFLSVRLFPFLTLPRFETLLNFTEWNHESMMEITGIFSTKQVTKFLACKWARGSKDQNFVKFWVNCNTFRPLKLHRKKSEDDLTL